MRKVSIDRLTHDMVLGKPVMLGDAVLIRDGVSDLIRYRNRLLQIGVHSLYIEDDASNGIIIDDPISDRLRFRCKRTLSNTIEQLRSNVLVDNGEIKHLIESMLEEILSRPQMLMSMSDIGRTGDNTLEHSINTTIYAIYLGGLLNFSRPKLTYLAEGLLLHDIGKTLLERSIIFKKGKLTPEEFDYVKTHTTLGYDLLGKNHGLSEPSRQIALCHHERIDGSGYPNGMAGKELSDVVRMSAVVDTYEALTADRCYRPAMPPAKAIQILYQEADTKLDLTIVSEFVKHLAVYPNGTLVTLSDGNTGLVQMQNPSMPLRPVVRIIQEIDGKPAPVQEIDLLKTLNVTILDG